MIVFWMLILAPFAVEGLLTCLAHWRSMFGQVVSVPTPCTDALLSLWNSLIQTGSSQFHNTPWKASKVMAILLAIAAACATLMRRRS